MRKKLTLVEKAIWRGLIGDILRYIFTSLSREEVLELHEFYNHKQT